MLLSGVVVQATRGEGEDNKKFVINKKALKSWVVVAHTYNPSTWEVEAGGSL